MNALKNPSVGVAMYNPQLQGKHELMHAFVAREPLLKRFVTSLHRELGGQPQHHLIVGARGMGKTTLLLRLRYAIEDDPELAAHDIGLTFPEQQANIASLADLWLNAVDASATWLEDAGHTAWVAELDRQASDIRALPSPGERRRLALQLLCRLAKRLGRRLILLVDNLDRVLDQLGDTDQWALREVLSSESQLQLIGTSSSLESHYRHDKAFYDFFRVHTLFGFDEPEAFGLLAKLAEQGGHSHVAELLETDPARIQTVHRLAGGAPRTLVTLSCLLAQASEGDARTDTLRLLDHLTPMYQHRVDSLAVQAQKVLDALAMHWHPATAAELATPDLKVSVVSSQLNRLAKDGIVEKVQ
ncbi:MAG: ATP-binding protein, partial [Nannocystaceae bacterium]